MKPNGNRLMMQMARQTSKHKNQKRVSLGVEVETYTIRLRTRHIGRHVMLPQKWVIENEEDYHHDRSIGIEYNSRPFYTIREALFGIKMGLRKSIASYKLENKKSNGDYTLFFAGTWRDRFAGTHFHIGLGEEGIEFDDAVRLSRHVHGHLPLLIALLANSPVFKSDISNFDSNRFLYAEKKFFYPLKFGELDQEYKEEMTFNRDRAKLTPTLEVRPCDANLPEYVAAGLVILKAIAMAWLARKPVANINRHELYLKSRLNAAKYGPRATLYWNNRKLGADAYLDKFFRAYQPQLVKMDIPPEVFEVFRLFRLGWNGAGIMRRACRLHCRRHPRTWERYFAEDYIAGINALLNGETLETFIRSLGLRPPNSKRAHLG
jgi:hypothetical protein